MSEAEVIHPELVQPPVSLAVVAESPTPTVSPQHEQISLDREQLDLLKRTLAADANLTDAELLLYGQVAERKGLDPFSNEIHVAKRGGKLTFQTGIDAFRRKAQETGLYAGQDAPQWCGEDMVWRDVWFSKEPPVACRVTVYRKDWGDRGLTVIAHWSEYVQRKYNGDINSMWIQRGPAQLAKCAEALALRKAFPQTLGGLYTNDEMAQADNPQGVISGGVRSDQAITRSAVPALSDAHAEALESIRQFFNSVSKDKKDGLKAWWKLQGDLPSSGGWPSGMVKQLDEAQAVRVAEECTRIAAAVPEQPNENPEPEKAPDSPAPAPSTAVPDDDQGGMEASELGAICRDFGVEPPVRAAVAGRILDKRVKKLGDLSPADAEKVAARLLEMSPEAIAILVGEVS